MTSLIRLNCLKTLWILSFGFFLLIPIPASAESAESAESVDEVDEVDDVDEVQVWLGKMDKALKEQNYQGIYTYMRGRQFNTVTIEHQFIEGQEHERLFHLNGEAREIERKGKEIVCYHLSADNHSPAKTNLDHEVPMGPFTRMFNENLVANKDLYNISLHGKGRIADRSAIRMAITPTRNDRYGYRLWLDEETGLLLQSHLVNRGRVLEVFQFVKVDIGVASGEFELASQATEDTLKHLISPDPQSDLKPVKPNWQARWLPRGFRPVSVPRDGNRMVFTDGMATLSVFVERTKKVPGPELSTLKGGTVVFSRPRQTSNGSQQITVVGEVPLDTAKRIAESIEPVIY